MNSLQKEWLECFMDWKSLLNKTKEEYKFPLRMVINNGDNLGVTVTQIKIHRAREPEKATVEIECLDEKTGQTVIRQIDCQKPYFIKYGCDGHRKRKFLMLKELDN